MTRVAIKDICNVYDGPHATPVKTQTGPIYLGIDAITSEGKLDKSQYSHLSEEDYKKWSKRVTPKYGDIVFSYEATLGRYALIPKGFYGCLGRRLAVIRNISPDIDTTWLYYYFRSDEWNKFIQSKVIKGSTVNRISIEDFPSYTIPLIPINKQKEIVSILSVIDNKIQVNNEINNNLQQIATSLFDYSFAKRKTNGKLSDILLENPKSSIQVNNSDGVVGEYPFFTSGETVNEWNGYLVDGINCYLSTGGNATIKVYDGKAAYSTDTWCIHGKDNYSSYLYFYLKSIIKSINSQFFAGSGLKHLQKGALLDVKLYIPSIVEIDEFNKIVNPILNKLSHIYIENKNLIKQRDFLLPLLMNGQATIDE